MHLVVCSILVLLVFWSLMGPVIWSHYRDSMSKAAGKARQMREIKDLRSIYIYSFILGGPIFWVLRLFGLFQGASEFFAEDVKRIKLISH